jgi:hypothetical protein
MAESYRICFKLSLEHIPEVLPNPQGKLHVCAYVVRVSFWYEVEIKNIFQNVSNKSPNDTTLHSRRLESSVLDFSINSQDE